MAILILTTSILHYIKDQTLLSSCLVHGSSYINVGIKNCIKGKFDILITFIRFF